MFLSPCRDDHGFSPLHWACREGRSSVVDMLIMRGARINVMNRGDDTPLHLAASHGHRDIVGKVRKHWGMHTVRLKKVTSWFLWLSCDTTVELLVMIIRIWATILTLDRGWLSLNGLFVRINLIKCQTLNSFSLEIKLKIDARAVKLTSVSPLQPNLPVQNSVSSSLPHTSKILWNLKWCHLNSNYKDKSLVCSCSSTSSHFKLEESNLSVSRGNLMFQWCKYDYKTCLRLQLFRIEQAIYDAKEVEIFLNTFINSFVLGTVYVTICSFFQDVKQQDESMADGHLKAHFAHNTMQPAVQGFPHA